MIDLLKEAEFFEYVRGAYRGAGENEQKLPYTERETLWTNRLDAAKSNADARVDYVTILQELARELRRNEAIDRGADNQKLQTLGASLRGIGKREAVIYTLVSADRLRLLVATRQRLVHRDIAVSAESLAHAVFDLRAAVRAPSSDPRPAAQRLYDLTLGPVRDLIKTRATSLCRSTVC